MTTGVRGPRVPAICLAAVAGGGLAGAGRVIPPDLELQPRQSGILLMLARRMPDRPTEQPAVTVN